MTLHSIKPLHTKLRKSSFNPKMTEIEWSLKETILNVYNY